MTDISGSTGGEPSIAGTGSQPMATVRASMDADVRPINKLKDAIKTLREELKKTREEFEALGKASSAGLGAGGTTSAGTRMASFSSTSQATSDGGFLDRTRGAFSALGGGRGAAGIAGAFSKGVMTAVNAMDARADRGRAYALSADRMSLLYQQMTGMSQVQVQDVYRQPLTDYRLGYGGINQLLAMQASTGISAAQQAPGVEALRTMTGFSLSTAGATNIITSLAAPEVANRMFIMGGGGLIGPGGGQRNIQDVIQSIVRTAGLTDERIVKGAFAPGSITRSRLTQMGVAPDLQDIVLQYAQQNIQYRRAGGRGMYDPSNAQSRELMGIESNFATQAEETERLRVARDEQFYSRQADNFADLEKQTQRLVKAFTELEDRLSGLIGGRISSRVSGSVLGAVGGVVGGLAGLAFGNPALGLIAGGAVGNIVGGFIPADPMSSHLPVRRGDPVGVGGIRSSALDASISVPTYSGKKTLNEVKTMSSFKKLHPKMQDRILSMMRENPNVGIGEGYRSVESQSSLFYERYDEVSADSEYDIEWNGSFWKKKPGVAPAAPPGRSMHGVGLAADLMGDLNWVVKNAHRFGLQHFNDVNNEPWHVQLAELPQSFREYEKAGAPLGLGPDSYVVQSVNKKKGVNIGSTPIETSNEEGLGFQALEHLNSGLDYQSISSRVAMGTLAGTIGRYFEYGAETSSTTRTPISSRTGVSGGRLSGEEVARLLYGVGFRGNDLIKMLAISERESGWNPSAHNPNRSSGDNSYGLLQLNTLGSLWSFYEQRGLTSRDQLLDPLTNVRMAKELFDASKKWNDGNGFYYWGDYANSGPGSALGHTDTAKAAEIVNSMDFNRGDPVVGLLSETKSASKGSGSNVSVMGGHTFNISPTIQMSGNGSGSDLQQIAREVARMIQREIELSSMRSN